MFHSERFWINRAKTEPQSMYITIPSGYQGCGAGEGYLCHRARGELSVTSYDEGFTLFPGNSIPERHQSKVIWENDIFMTV